MSGPNEKDIEDLGPEDYEAAIDDVEERGGIQADVEDMYGPENVTDGDDTDDEDDEDEDE